MVICIVLFWILSLVMAITCLIYLIIGITYKNYKKILTAITAMFLSILFYYLPFYLIMNNIIKALKNLHSHLI